MYSINKEKVALVLLLISFKLNLFEASKHLNSLNIQKFEFFEHLYKRLQMATAAELFQTGHVIDKNGNQVDLASYCAGKTVGFYFSASWCLSCRGFTSILKNFYTTYKDEKNFEIIFVSSDKTQASFDTYYSSMPWLALDYNDRNLAAELISIYTVTSIPTLVLINADSGLVYTLNGKNNLLNDLQGTNFPWSV